MGSKYSDPLPARMALWHDRPDAWREVLPGVRRRILSGGDGVMLVLYHLAPHRTFPRHTHRHLQAGVCLEGSGELTVGESVYPIRSGSSYSIAGDVPHEFRSGPETRTVILDVFVPEREDFAEELRPPDEA